MIEDLRMIHLMVVPYHQTKLDDVGPEEVLFVSLSKVLRLSSWSSSYKSSRCHPGLRPCGDSWDEIHISFI